MSTPSNPPKIDLPENSQEGVHWTVTGGETDWNDLPPATGSAGGRRYKIVRQGTAVGVDKYRKVWVEYLMDGSDDVETEWVFRNIRDDKGTYPVQLLIFLEEPHKPVKVVVLRSWRGPLTGWMWELPGGGAEEIDGGSVKNTALREAHEETGYGKEDDSYIDDPVLVRTAPGKIDRHFWQVVIHVPSYRESDPPRMPTLEPDEIHQVHIVELERAMNQIKQLAGPDDTMNNLLFTLTAATIGFGSKAGNAADDDVVQEKDDHGEGSDLMKRVKELENENELLRAQLAVLS